MFVTPAVVGETAFLGSCSGRYYGFDVASGSIVWSYDLKSDVGQATFHGDPLAFDNLIITGTEALTPPETWAFDRVDGRVVWRNQGDFAFTRSDIIEVGDLAVGRNEHGELVAVYPMTGNVAWRLRHDGERFEADVAESPATDGSLIVFSGPDGVVYQVDGEDGSVLWQTRLDCDASTSTAFQGSDVYVGCRNGLLFRISGLEGAILDTISLNVPLEGRLLVLDDRIIVPGGSSWIGAVSRSLETILWERSDLYSLSVVQPLRWRGEVITGTGGGKVIGLDLEDGHNNWAISLDGRIRGLGEAGAVILVGTIEGKLFAVRRRD